VVTYTFKVLIPFIEVSALLRNFCNKKQENEEGRLKLYRWIYFHGTYPSTL